MPVPRNIEIEHCSHLLSYLFVHVFFLFCFLISATVHGLYIGCTSQRRDSDSYLVSFYFSERGGGMSRYCCVTAYVFFHVFGGSLMVVRAKYETRDLACIVGFHMTSHYVVAQRSKSIDW